MDRIDARLHECFPSLIGADDAVGTLTPAAAADLGLDTDVVVGPGEKFSTTCGPRYLLNSICNFSEYSGRCGRELTLPSLAGTGDNAASALGSGAVTSGIWVMSQWQQPGRVA